MGQEGRAHQRVVIITPYFWPQTAACTMLYASLASGLAEAGAEVTVLTNQTSADLDLPFPVQPYHSPKVIRFWNPFTRRLGVLNKLLEYAWFAIQVMVRLLLGPSTDQIFLASNPPLMAVPIGLIARLRRARLHYNLQDLFPDSAISAQMIRKDHWFFKILKAGERLNYRLSHRIIAISDGFADRVKELAPHADVLTIPNWVDTDFMAPASGSVNRFLESVDPEPGFLALYAGNMGYAHNLDVLVEAAGLLRDAPSVRFIFVGEGNARADAQARVAELGLRNCTFHGFQPFDWLPDLHNACQVGLVAVRSGAESSSIPSKTWNFLACAKPVIACVERPSELASVLDSSGAGIVVGPNDPHGVAEAVQRLVSNPALAEEMGQRGRAYVMAHISRPAIVGALCRAILN